MDEGRKMTLFAYYGLTTPEDEAEASRPEYSDYPLTEAETDEYLALEAIIDKGLKTFVEVGNALMIIRDKRYYREYFNTFEDYCRDRWGIERRHAYRLIDGAAAVENVSHGTQNEILPTVERQARPLTQLPPGEQAKAWQEAVDTAPNGKVTAKHVEETVTHFQERKNGMGQELQVLLSHESTEWYTPAKYIDLAKRVMGDIDLDPASSEAAQQIVQALHFFTIEDDGLTRPWSGRVWLNPPYSTTEGKSNQELWSQKLIKEYQLGNVTEAVLLVKSALGYNWFEALWDQFPVCFARELIQFVKADGSIAGKAKLGSAFFYLGPNLERFQEVFGDIGRIVTIDGIVYESRPLYD